MTAQAWIALAALAAALVVQGLLFAFLLGGLFARVKQVEADHEDKNILAVGIATLTAKMGAVEVQIADLRNTLLAPQAPRRRATAV